MQRILVDLPEETVKELEALATQKQTSRAEIIRQATDRMIKVEKEQNSARAFDSVFGIWKHHPMADKELQKLRDEWSR